MPDDDAGSVGCDVQQPLVAPEADHVRSVWPDRCVGERLRTSSTQRAVLINRLLRC